MIGIILLPLRNKFSIRKSDFSSYILYVNNWIAFKGPHTANNVVYKPHTRITSITSSPWIQIREINGLMYSFPSIKRAVTIPSLPSLVSKLPKEWEKMSWSCIQFTASKSRFFSPIVGSTTKDMTLHPSHPIYHITFKTRTWLFLTIFFRSLFNPCFSEGSWGTRRTATSLHPQRSGITNWGQEYYWLSTKRFHFNKTTNCCSRCCSNLSFKNYRFSCKWWQCYDVQTKKEKWYIKWNVSVLDTYFHLVRRKSGGFYTCMQQSI